MPEEPLKIKQVSRNWIWLLAPGAREMEMKADRLLLDKASAEWKWATRKLEWHFLSTGCPVSKAWTSSPSPSMQMLPGPLTGVLASRPATPNAGHVFGKGWRSSFIFKDIHKLSSADTSPWPKKQHTFYSREPLGMNPVFRISSSHGCAIAKLSKLELD